MKNPWGALELGCLNVVKAVGMKKNISDEQTADNICSFPA